MNIGARTKGAMEKAGRQSFSWDAIARIGASKQERMRLSYVIMGLTSKGKPCTEEL